MTVRSELLSEGVVYDPSFSWGAPEMLGLLIFLLPLGAVTVFFLRRRRHARAQLSFPFVADLPLLPLVSLTLVTLLIGALARPSAGTFTVQIPQASHSLFLAIDVSRSMRVRDLPPDRITVVQRRILDFLSEVEQRRLSARIGILLFAGEAVMYCPLTSDLETLRLYMRELSPELLSARGSSLEAVLRLVNDTMSTLQRESYSVAIFSDGEFSDEGDLASLTRGELRTRLLTFGVGTAEGGPIPLARGALQKDRSGEIVISRRESRWLEQLARESGGSYHPLSQAPAQTPLEPLIRLITSDLEEFGEGEHTVVQPVEVGVYLIWAALLVVALTTLLPLRAGLFLLLLGAPVLGSALLSPTPVSASDTEKKESDSTLLSRLERANAAFHDKNYKAALSLYRQELQERPEAFSAALGKGATLFRLERYTEAEEEFLQIARQSDEGRTVFQALYNAGNSAFAADRFREAVQYYDRALSLFPESRETRFNRKLAQERLQEQEDSSEENDSPENRSQEEKEQEETEEQEDGNSQKEEQGEGQEQRSREENSDEGQETAEERSSSENNEEKGESEQEPSSGKDGSEGDHKQKESERKSAEERQENAPGADGETSPTEGTSAQETEGGAELSIEERAAQTWLQSLPETPLLLRRYQGKSTSQNEEHTW
ncbi:VWA domain-containing protein [bacterium]|nr:VWA domain-containing protein [bacterium]